MFSDIDWKNISKYFIQSWKIFLTFFWLLWIQKYIFCWKFLYKFQGHLHFIRIVNSSNCPLHSYGETMISNYWTNCATMTNCNLSNNLLLGQNYIRLHAVRWLHLPILWHTEKMKFLVKNIWYVNTTLQEFLM